MDKPLSVLLVADDGREFRLAEFNDWFTGLSKRAQEFIITEGYINDAGCEVFWEWLGRSDDPPRRVTVFIDRNELEQKFPGIRRH